MRVEGDGNGEKRLKQGVTGLSVEESVGQHKSGS